MLTLSDSTLRADHRAMLAGPQPCGKQAAAAVFSWSFTICTLSFTHHNTRCPVADIAFLCVCVERTGRSKQLSSLIYMTERSDGPARELGKDNLAL